MTNRANSVFTGAHAMVAGADVEALVVAAEAFYAARAQNAIFHLSPTTAPHDLDARLARRGYAQLQPSEVMQGRAHDVLDRTGDEAHGVQPFLSARAPDSAWLDCAFALDSPEHRAVHAAVVRRIARPTLFASLRIGGAAVACGLGVSDGGFTGIYSMATHPAHRGRGLARALLHRFAAWALERGDHGLYLLVQSDNEVARALYARVGFEPAYGYHFRMRPAAELPPARPV